MADIALDVVVSTVARFLIEEYAVLGDAARHVEWIEKELRSMRGLLEQVEQRGDGEQEQALKEWAEMLKDVALDAKNVIETFVIKSVKRRRWGVLHWFDKYHVGKELEPIRKRMRAISYIGMNLNKNVLSISVETPLPNSSSTSTTTTTIVATAMEKIDDILSHQKLITSNKVIEMVEQVKDGLKDLQNIVSKLKSTNERETVWLKEVKDVCKNTADVAGKFIVRREKWLKMSSSSSPPSRSIKVLHHYASSAEFKKHIEHARTQIGDALHRSWTYRVVEGGDMNETTTQRSTTVPIQYLSLESLIISELIPFSMVYTASSFFPSFGDSLKVALLVVIISQVLGVVAIRGPIRARKLKANPKRRSILLRLLTSSIFLYTMTGVVLFLLSLILPIQVALLFQLSLPLYRVIVWNVKLWKSVDDNLNRVLRDLDLMHAFLRDTTTAENEQVMMNERQKAWVGQLRLVAQSGKSFLDAAAKGYGGSWRKRIKFAKDINCVTSRNF